MLAVSYKRPGITYHEAIRQWLDAQRNDLVYALVGFLNVPLGQAPRVYIARPPQIATQLSAQCSGQDTALYKRTHRPITRVQRIRTKFRLSGFIPRDALTLYKTQQHS